MEREFITIVTPIGKQEVKFKAWLTGRERRAISEAFMEGTEFVAGETTPKRVFSGETINKMRDAAIQAIVVSIDGNTENTLDKILDMRDTDYDFIVDEVNKINNPPDLKK